MPLRACGWLFVADAVAQENMETLRSRRVARSLASIEGSALAICIRRATRPTQNFLDRSKANRRRGQVRTKEREPPTSSGRTYTAPEVGCRIAHLPSTFLPRSRGKAQVVTSGK